jgi:hypothetical protein
MLLICWNEDYGYSEDTLCRKYAMPYKMIYKYVGASSALCGKAHWLGSLVF